MDFMNQNQNQNYQQGMMYGNGGMGMQNPGMFNYGGMYGNVRQPNMQVPTFSNPLTEEELKLLQEQVNPKFQIKPTEVEKLQGICTHHYKNTGEPAVDLDPRTNVGICRICGTKIDFNQNLSREEAEELVAQFANLQEMIKFTHWNLPERVERDLFGNTIPFNRKMDKLYAHGRDEINRIQNPYPYANYGNAQGMAVWRELNGIGAPMWNQMNPQNPGMMGPGVPMGGYMGNPMVNPNMNVFAGAQQPQYGMGMQPMNAYGMNQNVGGNPLYNDGAFQGGMQQNGMTNQCQPTQQNATQETTGATTVKQTNL